MFLILMEAMVEGGEMSVREVGAAMMQEGQWTRGL